MKKTHYAILKLTEKELDALLGLCNEFNLKVYPFTPTRKMVEETKAINRAANNLCDALDEISEKKTKARYFPRVKA